MPIQEGNIVFLESQVLDDVSEGGGAATGNVVPDGVLNNVFEDISDLDRAYGRFNLRKLFVGVRSLDTDLYGGAKLAVTALPSDPALGYTLFTTNDPFDTRTDAADAVEAYLYKGTTWHGVLMENHIAGMRTINLIQRVGTATPTIGKTLCLVQDEGTISQKEQYVRVTDVATIERTFSYFASGGVVDYVRLVVTLDLSDALRHDFDGHSPNPTDEYTYDTKCRVRDTTVADATMYYSSQPVSETAATGDLRVRAASMFTQLVPSAQTETPLVNQIMAGTVTATIDAGNGHTVSVPQAAHSLARNVTAENRRLNWIETLSPIPARSTLNISFMSQGNWYELTDNGAGILSGSDSGIGAGTADYDTGAIAITLGALPDAGSQIIWTWGSPIHYAIRAGSTSDTDSRGARVSFQLTETPVVPDSLTITFVRGGTTITATTNASGIITATGLTGTINIGTGAGELFFTQLPDTGTALILDWDYRLPDDPAAPTEIRMEGSLNGSRTIAFSQAVTPNSVAITVPFLGEDKTISVSVVDNGSGQLVAGSQFVGHPDPVDIGGSVVGSINYSTGLCTLSGSFTAPAGRVYQTGIGD